MKFASFSFNRAVFALLLIALITSFTTIASADKHRDRGGINIENFGQVDNLLYRGGQPEVEDIHALARMGVKTVIDLRDDPEDFERGAVMSSGMRYINIPMSSKSLPRDHEAERFLQAVQNRADGPFYVHCAGGRHRTGVMVAVYRLNYYNWDFDQAYAEMKDYDFSTSWGHGPMKDFIVNYYKGYHRSDNRQPVADNGARAMRMSR